MNVRIDFFNKEINPSFNNSFQISLSSSFGNSISLNLYYEKNYSLNGIDKFCLDNYDGSFKDKVDNFFIFLDSLLNISFIKKAIEGREWSNEYYIGYMG